MGWSGEGERGMFAAGLWFLIEFVIFIFVMIPPAPSSTNPTSSLISAVESGVNPMRFSMVHYGKGLRTTKYTTDHLRVVNLSNQPVPAFRCWVQVGNDVENPAFRRELETLFLPSEDDIFGNQNVIYKIEVPETGVFVMPFFQAQYFIRLDDYREVDWSKPDLYTGYIFEWERETLLGPLSPIPRVKASFWGAGF